MTVEDLSQFFASLDTEVDHHCFKVGGNNVWILRNELHDCQGDGIQVGDQNNSPGAIRDIYIVDNNAHGNLQTGYWVKNATDVLIAYNRARDHNTGGVQATAMRVINAIPTLCQHAPGVVSTLDLPYTPSTHVRRD